MTSDSLLLQLLEDMPSATLLVTVDRQILYANPAAETLLMQTVNELRDRILPLEFNDNFIGSTANLALPNGDMLPVRYINVPTFWHGQSVRMVHLEDVSVLHGLQEQLTKLANYDVITELPNRGLLEDRLKQAFSLGQRHQHYLAVVFLDLDGFRPVNDALGHELGDKLLQAVARRLQTLIRPGDTLARFGGDEFVVVLPELNHFSDAAMVTERILESLTEPFVVDCHELQISASAGIALTELYDEPPLQLLRHADMAMSEAKKHGRNTYQWFDPQLDNATVRALKLRNALQAGIEHKQFTLYYQPQFNLANNEIVGCEALVRWQHPSMGLISPIDFISLAETTGQIVALGRWILQRACKDFAELQPHMAEGASVSVNISAIQLVREEFVNEVERALQAAGLDASRLVLEMTESVLVDHPQIVSTRLQQLEQLGVKVALDDFGTGYSSLSYLKDLAVSWVKIDRSFITDVIHHRKNAAITEGIIAMAHHLGLGVLAEGVETAAQRDYLRRATCDAMQGFLLAKPMSKQDAIDFMSSYCADRVAPSDGQAATILIVDDEENVLKSLRRLLARDGYHILTASSAAQAFESLAQHSVRVVLSDQRMPQMLGVDFLSHVRSMYPTTARIVLTAYQDEEMLAKAVNEGGVFRCLTKPWDDDKLRQAVRTAVATAER